MLIGIDTGGTFTDFLWLDGQSLKIHKVLSTPDAPQRAILQGLSELGASHVDIVHGSTVATNAVLEGKGVATVVITNPGLEDMLTIGRQARHALYDLQPEPCLPPVPARLCLSLPSRMSAKGECLIKPTRDDLNHLAMSVQALQPEAIAISLLFSFLDPQCEHEIADVLQDIAFTTCSADVLPAMGEYERSMATWLNAYVGPLMQRYLSALQQALPESMITVMQSSGATIAADKAGQHAVHLLLSGPAGGLMAARYIGQHIGRQQLLTFDMGGTSTDVALIDGEICLTAESTIGRYPIAVPMVDMHTIGAGGGSIAIVDEGGVLSVGPESAGANPGPACYGNNGRQATVTDAHLVLGYLQSDHLLGGSIKLDVSAAYAAIQPLASALNLSCEQVAEGIIQIANEHMVNALKVISVQKGIDAQSFTLMSFGGAGGLHVCALADALSIKQAIVPIYAGILSALGMVIAPRGRQIVQAQSGKLLDLSNHDLKQIFDQLAEKGINDLVSEGVMRDNILSQYFIDCRYVGQSSTLELAWEDCQQAELNFQQIHQQRYGFQLPEPVEVVNLRVSLLSYGKMFEWPQWPLEKKLYSPVKVRLLNVQLLASVWPRQALHVGQLIMGPALITEMVATTYIAPTWSCRVDSIGNLILEKENLEG